MPKRRLYFAHPINVYGTELQRTLLKAIQEVFPGCEVECPDGDRCVASAGEVDGVVFLAFRDGQIGKDIFDEVEWFLKRQLPVYEIYPDGGILLRNDLNPLRRLTVDETRARIRNQDRTPKPY